MEFSNVSSAEPSLAVLVHKEVVLDLAFAFVVTHCDIGPTNQNFPSWVGLVCAVVTT